MVRADKHSVGSGEAAARAQSRRFWTIIATLAVAGFAVGLASSFLESDAPRGELFGALPPWFAMLAAGVSAVALIGGTWLFYKRVDEVERHDNLVAATVGANVVMIGYPIWFFLWKGGLAPEPDHLVLAGSLFVGTTLAYFYKKLF